MSEHYDTEMSIWSSRYTASFKASKVCRVKFSLTGQIVTTVAIKIVLSYTHRISGEGKMTKTCNIADSGKCTPRLRLQRGLAHVSEERSRSRTNSRVLVCTVIGYTSQVARTGNQCTPSRT